MRVLKAGGLYFALAFAAGWVFGPIRELWVVPRLGKTVGVLLEAPLMLAVIIIAARWTVRRFAVSPALTMRLAVGLVALGLLVAAEVLLSQWLRGLSFADLLASLGSPAGAITLVLYLIFAAMPMVVARR